MSESCATCRFFRMHPKADETWKHGDCRLKPPHAGEYWPTPPKDGWCGEHQPREPEQPKAREPGWYWVQLRNADDAPGDWRPNYWWSNLDMWEDAHVLVCAVGPRLEPPA